MTQQDLLAIIKERGNGDLGTKMGIEIIEASAQRLVATMPVEGNTQPAGLLHGGKWSVLISMPLIIARLALV
jgi:1,4-dihydroxy-2-naphthoyl-CoA hydrolase